MEQNKNPQIKLEEMLSNAETKGKTLFLHSCCAPCSSYVLTYLRSTFKITVFYYNPNITADEEYRKRADEEKRFIEALNRDKEAASGRAYPITYVEGKYDPNLFLEAVKGYEQCPERGERCAICFRLRLSETAKEAAQRGADYYATTLTLSPLKDAVLLNRIGEEEGKKHHVEYLPTDFKKKGGYLKSIELSKEYGLYRQDFCGCMFSKAERAKQKEERGEAFLDG